MQVTDSYNDIFSTVSRVLVVLSHPDDAEIVAGGLIARLSKDGKLVRLVVTTNGGKGMQDKKGIVEKEFLEKRIEEQRKSGEILGITDQENFNLNIPDGEFENSYENIGKIVFHIRDFKPDLVITHNPTVDIINFNNSAYWVNHRDHRLTGQSVLDAVYPYSRDRGFFPEHFSKGVEPHTVNMVLLADSYMHPEVRYFNIGECLEIKKKAIMCHSSAINPDYADDYIEENKYGDGYYEPLRFLKVY